MQERSKMLAPLKRSIAEPELLPEVRSMLSLRPELANHPECLAAKLGAEENGVQACLTALELEGFLCP
jgi:hypothetical protein